MLLAAPGQARRIFPLPNSSSIPTKEICPNPNTPSVKLNGSPAVTKPMPKTSKTSNNNNDSNSASTSRKSQQNLSNNLSNNVNNSSTLSSSSPPLNNKSTTTSTSTSTSNSSSKELQSSIPKLIIAAKNSSHNHSKRQPSTSKRTNININKIANLKKAAAATKELVLNLSPISVESSSSSSSSSSNESSPSPDPETLAPIVNEPNDKTLPPTTLHRSEKARRDDKCKSSDSLSEEMCHFKPIRSVPITPYKVGNSRSRGGGAAASANAFSLKCPTAIRPTKVNLNTNCDDKSYGNKDKIRKTVAGLKLKKSKLILPSMKHKSAFVVLITYDNEALIIPQLKNLATRKKSLDNSDLEKQAPEFSDDITSPPPPAKKRKTAKPNKKAKKGSKAKKAEKVEEATKTVKTTTSLAKPNNIRAQTLQAQKKPPSKFSSKVCSTEHQSVAEGLQATPRLTRSQKKEKPSLKLNPGFKYYEGRWGT